MLPLDLATLIPLDFAQVIPLAISILGCRHHDIASPRNQRPNLVTAWRFQSARLIGDLVVVRLQGVLTAAEQQLVKSLSAEKRRDLLKQVRTQLIETARPLLEKLLRDIAGVKVLSLHHDINTVTGEEVVLFTLAESPQYREAKKKSICQSRSHRSHPPLLGRPHDRLGLFLLKHRQPFVQMGACLQ